MSIAKKFSIIGPGLLLAATGLGGGDLATGSIVGSILGVSVLWAVILGVALKYSVSEGLVRWQLATKTTLLEGIYEKLGVIPIYFFLVFLFIWTLFVGAAQMSACGITLYALFPFFSSPELGKIVFGIFSSLIGLILVWIGGYKIFDKLMKFFIFLMFFTVLITAFMLWPSTDQVLRGIFIPRVPNVEGGIAWTVALIGGIGGTVTVLGYGYWIKEENRESTGDLSDCRLDLRFGYLVTAIFGMAMIIIGNQITIEGQGATLLVQLSNELENLFGITGKYIFLIGAWGAVFTSLLGVWQSVPYIFADCIDLITSPKNEKNENRTISTKSSMYKLYLVFISIIPMYGLFVGFTQIQRLYTITGALFFPLLALVLLFFNNSNWVGELKNNLAHQFMLIINLAFFGWIFFNTF